VRFHKAFPLFVSLTLPALAADWAELHDRGIAAVGRRDFQSAAASFREALPLAQNPLERGLSSNDLGIVLHHLGQESESRRALETAFAIWKSLPRHEHRLAITAEALAAVNRTQGDYAGAERLLRTTLTAFPYDGDDEAILSNELGDLLREIGHTTEARQLFEKVSRLSGVAWRRQIDAQIGLADLDRDAHLWESSIDGWNKAADLARLHSAVILEASALRGLGATWLDRGNPDRAEPLLKKALAVFERDFPGDHQVASTLTCLGQLYLAQNKLAMAEDALDRALRIDEIYLGPNHPQNAVLYGMLGDTLARRGRIDDARAHFERARLIMAAKFGEDSPAAAAIRASWALSEQHASRYADAVGDYEKALAVLNNAGPDVEGLRRSVTLHYAETLKAVHRKQEAKAIMKSAFAK